MADQKDRLCAYGQFEDGQKSPPPQRGLSVSNKLREARLRRQFQRSGSISTEGKNENRPSSDAIWEEAKIDPFTPHKEFDSDALQVPGGSKVNYFSTANKNIGNRKLLSFCFRSSN